MFRLQVLKDGVDDRFRHDHVQIGQRLARVAALKSLGQLVVVVELLARQLTDAAGGQHTGVRLTARALQGLLVLLLDVALDLILHVVEAGKETVHVAGLDGLLHLGAKLVAPGLDVVRTH